MLIRRQSLVFDSEAPSATGIAAPQITDTSPNPSIPSAPEPQERTTLSIDATPTPPLDDSQTSQTGQPGVATASSSSDSRINMGTVLGACLGSLALLTIVIALVVWHTRRSRRKDAGSRREGDWNKLSDKRDSRRSSFESKPSLMPQSYDYSTEYPPIHSDTGPSNPNLLARESPRFVLPSHPYSSSHSVIPTGGRDASSQNLNPFADPMSKGKDIDNETASFYSAASNPFESVYTAPANQPTRLEISEDHPRSPFFAPHPDSSVQREKWGSVGKERNVQESIAPSGSDKFGSLIAALDLHSSDKVDEGETFADRSMHGHLGKF